MAAPAALRPVGPALFELPIGFAPGMRVPVRVFGSEKLVSEFDDQVFTQAANVATLPGIVGASLCMPDAHWGSGFPIGRSRWSCAAVNDVPSAATVSLKPCWCAIRQST